MNSVVIRRVADRTLFVERVYSVKPPSLKPTPALEQKPCQDSNHWRQLLDAFLENPDRDEVSAARLVRIKRINDARNPPTANQMEVGHGQVATCFASRAPVVRRKTTFLQERISESSLRSRPRFVTTPCPPRLDTSPSPHGCQNITRANQCWLIWIISKIDVERRSAFLAKMQCSLIIHG